MSASVVSRLWMWRSFVWVGVIASVLAWAWVWFRVGGVSAVMVLVALAAVAFAFRATTGMRAALAGLMVAGFAMFLASLYWTYMLLFQGTPTVTVTDVLALSVFPMVSAIVLLLGSAAGYRHAESVRPTDLNTL
jgi:hypothetical protein